MAPGADQPAGLAEDVAAFLQQHIDSVPQLEGLLLLWQSPRRPWPAAELAARLYIQKDLAEALLAGLVRRHLAEATAAGYVFPPASPSAGLVSRVASVYRAQLLEVAGLIHSKASSGMREFAQAFRLKKEP